MLLEKEAHDRSRKIHARVIIAFRFLSGCPDLTKKTAERIASRMLSPHFNVNPMLAANSTPVELK
jgi:hypothetical protein